MTYRQEPIKWVPLWSLSLSSARVLIGVLHALTCLMVYETDRSPQHRHALILCVITPIPVLSLVSRAHVRRDDSQRIFSPPPSPSPSQQSLALMSLFWTMSICLFLFGFVLLISGLWDGSWQAHASPIYIPDSLACCCAFAVLNEFPDALIPAQWFIWET